MKTYCSSKIIEALILPLVGLIDTNPFTDMNLIGDIYGISPDEGLIGHETASIGSSISSAIQNTSDWVSSIFNDDGVHHIIGSSGADVFKFGDSEESYYIDGEEGSDTIVGSQGINHISGGAGFDTIFGGNSDDELDGGSGDDVILGAGGNDTIYGGTGNDKIYGGDGVNKINGGDGDDIIYGGSGDESASESEENPSGFLLGGAGDDKIYGLGGNDDLYGESGIRNPENKATLISVLSNPNRTAQRRNRPLKAVFNENCKLL